MRISRLKKLGFGPDVLLLLEHPATITLGRNGKWNHLLVSQSLLASKGVGCFEVDRGGDITFHGPGQLVGYPLLKLEEQERDVRQYMRNLEECLIRVLENYGIEAHRSPNNTGVWTGGGKIAAMGVHLSRWITRHGFALNVTTDLSFFEMIVPCGLPGRGVASMQSVLSRKLGLAEVVDGFIDVFGVVFDRRMKIISMEALEVKLKEFSQKHDAA
jgi:lipoate-protein ligase B